MKRINATEFKAKCLALLDEVHGTGDTIIIEKRGKPVAQLTSFVDFHQDTPQSSLRGTARVVGDIIKPVIMPEEWSVQHRKS